MGHVVKIAASNELPIKATISKCQQIPPLTYFTTKEEKARADTRLLQNTLRMECIVTCMHLIQLRCVCRYIFMLRPEWVQSHEISSASKGHGGMALIVHYFG